MKELFNSTVGPVGQLMAFHADRVRDKAKQNASGEIIGIRSGDLLSGLTARVEGTPLGVVGIVSTDAIHRGFGYPAFWDQHGRPWLTNALREEFPNAG